MNSASNHYNPVYRQSLAVADVGQAVAHYFSNDQPSRLKKYAALRAEIAHGIFTDALLIPKTIEGITLAKPKKHLKSQLTYTSVIIKNLYIYCNGLERDGAKEKEYINLLRHEVGNLKKAFKIWRKSLLA